MQAGESTFGPGTTFRPLVRWFQVVTQREAQVLVTW
jgi:hypothetical protein